MAGFNPYAAAGVPTPQVNFGQPSQYAGLYRKGATSGTVQGDPLANALRGLFGRPAAAEQMGPQIPPGLQAPPAPTLPSPQAAATLGATPVPAGRGPTPVIQAADETYKTLLSQYGGAPGVSQLAGMTSLPTDFTPTGATQTANLKDYYTAQYLQGQANKETIGNALTLGMEKGQAENMKAWVNANPMLAQRAYAQKFGMGAAGVNPVAGFGLPTQLAGQAPGEYQGESAGQVFADPKPPVNPMLGYGLNDSLVSTVSPQADFAAKFGLNGNFGSPGTVENSVLAGAVNPVPAPPAETQSKTDEFNNRVEATAGLRAKLSPQYASAFNTPLNFAQYFNPGGQ